MTSDKNLPEGVNTHAVKKVWTAPYFEIISMDKIKTGVVNEHVVEGSKIALGSGKSFYTTYQS